MGKYKGKKTSAAAIAKNLAGRTVESLLDQSLQIVSDSTALLQRQQRMAAERTAGTDPESIEYRAGADAYRTNRSFLDNPFKPKKQRELHQAWLAGWNHEKLAADTVRSQRPKKTRYAVEPGTVVSDGVRRVTALFDSGDYDRAPMRIVLRLAVDDPIPRKLTVRF